MVPMLDVLKMRSLYYDKSYTFAAIAREMGCDYRTVKTWVLKEDFSPEMLTPVPRASKLDPYKSFIDDILEKDRLIRFHKQRHTSLRIYERLQEEKGFTGSYSIVNRYVRNARAKLGMDQHEAYIPLDHPPGTAQCDFGTAEYIENGVSVLGRYVVLSFPYSNAGFLQLCPGENLECLLEGLQAIFQYINGVPTEIWFDNASAIVKNVLSDGKRDVTERFAQFEAHYGFKATFMNPASGNEKGNVERAVCALRNRFLVPVPSFVSIDEENRLLLDRCKEKLSRIHYKHDVPISELFAADEKAMLALNPHDFDTARYVVCRTDKYGKLVLDGLYTYSSSPAVNASTVKLRVTAREVTIYDEEGHEIVHHRRLYGPKAESMNWVPYLRFIARKPRALLNSGLFQMLPEDIQNFAKSCTNTQRGNLMRMLSDLTDEGGFDHAVRTLQIGIQFNATDPDSLKTLYRRMYSDIPVLPDIDISGTKIPQMPHIPANTDLAMLDQALRQGGTSKNV